MFEMPYWFRFSIQAWIAGYAQVDPAPVIGAYEAASAAGGRTGENGSAPSWIAANARAMLRTSPINRARRSARPFAVRGPSPAPRARPRIVLAFIATPEILTVPWPSAHGAGSERCPAGRRLPACAAARR